MSLDLDEGSSVDHILCTCQRFCRGHRYVGRTTHWRHRPYRQQELTEFRPDVLGGADQAVPVLQGNQPVGSLHVAADMSGTDADAMQIDGSAQGGDQVIGNTGEVNMDGRGGVLDEVEQDERQDMQGTTEDNHHVCRLLPLLIKPDVYVIVDDV